MYELVARNEKGKKIQVINRNEDSEYLDRIVDATEGIYWIGSECCSLHVEPDAPAMDTDGDINIYLKVYLANMIGNVGKTSDLVTKRLRLDARTTLREFESWTPAQLRKAISKKLTLSDLRIMYMNEPIDGISAYEELILRGVFGVHEKEWRAQREFFEFACRQRYNVERSALVSAAHAVVEAMRLAGEDEETIRRYKKNFIAPALRHC